MNTPSDGNCMFWSISDQTGVHHIDLRKIAVSKVKEMINQNILFWIETESIESWMDRMSQERCHGDNYALQVLRYLLLIFLTAKLFYN